jgi:hypothetical protein
MTGHRKRFCKMFLNTSDKTQTHIRDLYGSQLVHINLGSSYLLDSTCPPLSPSSHANSFGIGPAVINNNPSSISISGSHSHTQYNSHKTHTHTHTHTKYKHTHAHRMLHSTHTNNFTTSTHTLFKMKYFCINMFYLFLALVATGLLQTIALMIKHFYFSLFLS